ncbi:hypothetical protein ScPMuIL_001331 [Solemya velum]
MADNGVLNFKFKFNSINFTIYTLQEEMNEIGPKMEAAVLANFTNGTLKPDCIGKFEAHIEGDSQPDDSQKSKSHQNKRQTYLTAQTDKMKYRGSLESSQPNVSYYLGIRDPSSGKMQILDVATVNMFPVFTDSPTLMSKTPLRSETHQEVPKTYQEKLDSLTKEFGSLKKKRSLESRKKLKLEKDKLDKTMENATDHYRLTPNSKAVVRETAHDESSSILSPPCNRQADTPQDVYKLNDIISDQEMNDLTYAAQVFVNSTREEHKQWKENSVYPTFIINHICFLPLEEKARLFKSKCLMYMHYLMHVYQMNAKSLRKSYPLPSTWPITVRENMYARFMMSFKQSDKGSAIQRYMPSRYKDKVLLYILVLGLLIDNFHMELSDLMIDLKVGSTKLLTMLRFLGCHTKKNKIPSGEEGSAIDTHFAVLSIPLAEHKSDHKKKTKGTNSKR